MLSAIGLTILQSVIQLVTAQVNGNIAYFNATLNSTLDIRQTTINLDQTNVVYGFSFRTCIGGHLIKQTAPNGELFSIILTTDSLNLKWRHGNFQEVINVRRSFIGNKWYYLQLKNVLGQAKLIIQSGQNVLEDIVIANSTYRTSFWQLDFTGSYGLELGRSYTGCILQGPGIVFKNNLNILAVNIVWSENQCHLDACSTGKSLIAYIIISCFQR